MRNFLLLVLFYSLASCNNDIEPTPFGGIRNLNTAALSSIIPISIPKIHEINFEEDTLSYLALGDSYTIGSGVEERYRWPNQLVVSLKKNDITVRKPKIIAQSGWTTSVLIREVQKAELEEEYDLVSLLIGVNNQYRGGLFSTFQSEFLELLSISLGKSKSRSSVFVLSIPDYGVTPFGGQQSQISEEINMYNSWIEKACQANQIKFYNITDISRKAENDLSLLAPDNLHPSGKMYAEWINLIMNNQLSLFDQ